MIARKQAYCPFCKEAIPAIYANRGKTFVGDAFVKWDYENHNCKMIDGVLGNIDEEDPEDKIFHTALKTVLFKGVKPE